MKHRTQNNEQIDTRDTSWYPIDHNASISSVIKQVWWIAVKVPLLGLKKQWLSNGERYKPAAGEENVLCVCVCAPRIHHRNFFEYNPRDFSSSWGRFSPHDNNNDIISLCSITVSPTSIRPSVSGEQHLLPFSITSLKSIGNVDSVFILFSLYPAPSLFFSHRSTGRSHCPLFPHSQVSLAAPISPA